MWVKCIDYGALDVYMDNVVVFGLAIIKLELILFKENVISALLLISANPFS